MGKLNHRNIALRELKDMADKFPSYTLGEILYSVIREGVSGIKEVKDLKNLSDEEVYTMIEKANETETE